MTAPDLRVLVVAEDPLARAGLVALLTGEPGCVVVGQVAGTRVDLVDLDVYQPEVLVWDLQQAPLRAPAAGQDVPPTPLEHLASLRDAGYAMVVLLPDDTQVAAAWAAGVRCLLPRDVSAAQLATALTAAVQGLVLLDTTFATALLPTRFSEPVSLVAALTPREMEVLYLLAEGLPNKLIADRLRISEHTVKFHINALMSKLGAQSRTEAVVRATRLGVLTL